MSIEKEADCLKGKIKSLSEGRSLFIIGIDGRCASGKTSLAQELCKALDCNIIHTDDYYLQPFQRTEERYLEPGGNMDRERLLREVLIPLSQGKKPLYQPFDCKNMRFGKEIRLPERNIYIIEGSYSCHPVLESFYGLKIFVTTDPDTQKIRILERNGEEGLSDFILKWIPLEEKYFAAFDIEVKADVVVNT